MSEHKQSPEFLKHKGKIADNPKASCNCPESARKGARAATAAHKRNNAMKEALFMVMNMKANERDSAAIKQKFPELQDCEIDGFTEVAVMMREHARKVPAATAKLIEMTGGSEENKAAGMTIIVKDKETEAMIESLGDTIPQ